MGQNAQPQADAKTKFIGHSIGKAIYRKENCLVLTENRTCGNCAKHCPLDAIAMEPQSDGKALPKISHKKCIGCGSCEYHCPAKEKAIAVVGVEEQKFIS